jgi:hypothetical protein
VSVGGGSSRDKACVGESPLVLGYFLFPAGYWLFLRSFEQLARDPNSD